MNPLKVYACYNKDSNVRIHSSSGAVFSSLAEYVISRQGIVFGVAMAEDCYSAEFIAVTEQKELVKLRGSKYLQAKVGTVFEQVKKSLLVGKLVLFTGTGCQVNGLKCFLGKTYDNLWCVDVICHGVPSPALWKKYAQYQEKKNNGKLKAVNFRCKYKSWNLFGMEEIFVEGSQNLNKKLYISKEDDLYMQMFLKNYCLRPSCYNCTAKQIKMADLTIADFWGIEEVAPEMNDGLGTSLVLIRTNVGESIFEQVSRNMRVTEVSYAEGVKENPTEYRSCSKPPQRITFFEDMYLMGIEELRKKYAGDSILMSKVKKKIKNSIRIIKRVIGNKWGGG